ncbi:carbohydrate ABC transporter permease [Cohnella suwonensis]|uniref:Carbohydrate ABC transporter permease n=1 Tax=Cohnella suwonensis TaxID=696072 RepID=A0ABW0LQZ6_9BACL
MKSAIANNKLNSAPAFTALSYAIVTLIALVCVLPFIVLVSGALSSESSVLKDGYWFWPRGFSVEAFKYIFRYPEDVLSGYKVSIIVTGVGTILSLFISTMAAYVLSRKELQHRNKLAFFLFFTTLFNGGLAPYYIWLSRNLHLTNTYSVLILGPMFNVLYILILRSFIRGSVPEPLVESAKIDGAGDLRIFLQMVLPLTKPALASIGVFTALAYWNDWWTAMMFTNKDDLIPLQYLLYKMLSSINLSAAMAQHVTNLDAPKETFKLAMTVIATGPILLVFPFAQKYFVSGITIGAVKG